jgi:RNA-directed DNA polymerase
LRARRHFAAGLADAFCDGDWDEAALFVRGNEAMGRRPRWLRRVVADVLTAYPAPPLDRIGELARFLSEHVAVVEAFTKPRAPRLRRHFLPFAEMGERRWGVPPIATPGDLAAYLELDVRLLAWFADRRTLERVSPEPLRHYRYRWVPKRSSGMRLLEAPKPRLLAIQRRILHGILDRIPAHTAAHGFVAGRSIASFAAAHAGSDVVVRMDLESFFASVRRARVEAIFRAAGYPEEVARELAALTSNVVPASVRDRDPSWRTRRLLATPHLPQGAPTSPALANLAAHRLDARLAAAAATLGARYSRYADDLAFSGGDELARAAPRFETLVAVIAAGEGFALNHRKTRVMRRGARQRLAGLVVNAHPNVARADYDRLKAILHNAARTGPEAQNRDGHPDFRAHLRGRVAFVEMVNPARGARLRRWFARIEWP